MITCLERNEYEKIRVDERSTYQKKRLQNVLQILTFFILFLVFSLTLFRQLGNALVTGVLNKFLCYK